jgi:hypothetical protein
VGELSSRNFGLVIAYLIPGFVALLVLADRSATVQGWLDTSGKDASTVGGFLYAVLASLAAGVTLSAMRWASIDQVHHATGISKPNWRLSGLQENLSAFEFLRDSHFRYHQFYGNTLVALCFALVVRRSEVLHLLGATWWSEIGVAVTAAVLFAGSRDALGKYYSRGTSLLGAEESEPSMTNGAQHAEQAGAGGRRDQAAGKSASKETKDVKQPTAAPDAKQPRPAKEAKG